MATIWDYLVGSGGDQTLGQTQTAESPMPEYITDASARAIEAAKGVASEALRSIRRTKSSRFKCGTTTCNSSTTRLCRTGSCWS